jgi:6-phosphogluconolactonase
MLITLLSVLFAFEAPPASGPLVFIGPYTKPPSEGIYAFRLDSKSGSLQPLGLAAKVSNPSFVAIHPNGKFLYAVSENGTGVVTAFAIDREQGKLTELNHAPSKGDGPCHLSVHRSGRFLIAVNYGSGSVTRIPIDANGRLGEATTSVQHAKPTGGPGTDPKRQEGPHAHSVNFSPDGRFAIVADLGRDELITYKVDAEGLDQAQVVRLTPGSGPRHLSFHPSGTTAYAINELKSTVSVFDYDSLDGVLKEKQTISTLPVGFKGENSTAEVLVHPSGKFLYGSNRGHNSIAMFAIEHGGKLRFIGTEPTRGEIPRNFGIDPTGRWLIAANQNSNSIVVFEIDQKTGKLKAAGDPVAVGSPVCVRFLN